MNNRNNTRKSKSGAAVFVLLFVFAPLLIGFITGKGFAVALFSMAAVFAAAGWLFGSKMTQNEDNKAKRCTMQVNAVVVDNKVEVVQSHTWDSMRQAYDDSTYNSYTPIYALKKKKKTTFLSEKAAPPVPANTVSEGSLCSRRQYQCEPELEKNQRPLPGGCQNRPYRQESLYPGSEHRHNPRQRKRR